MQQLKNEWQSIWSKKALGSLCESKRISNVVLAETIHNYVDNALIENIKKGMNELNPSLIEKHLDEVILLVRLALASFTILSHGKDIGDMAANLKRVAKDGKPISIFQRVGTIILEIIIPYLFNKITEYMISSQWSSLPIISKRQNFWQACNKIEIIMKSVSLANFFIFLRTGEYSTLTDRILEIRRVPNDPSLRIELPLQSYRLKIALEALSEIFLFTTVHSSSSIRVAKRIIKRLYHQVQNLFSQDTNRTETLFKVPLKSITCPVCGLSPPAMPFQSLPCGHIYCYYCITSCLLDGDDTCERCGEKILSLQRYLPQSN